MDLNWLPWRNLSRRPLRTAALLVLTFFLSFVIFAGSMTVVSLQNGLETLENRLGADIIVVPNTAKRKVDPKNDDTGRGRRAIFTWSGKRWC